MRLLISIAAPALALAACTAKTEQFDAGYEEVPDGGFVNAPCPTTLPAFSVGMEGVGLTSTDPTGQIKVRIDQAPKPPEKDYNTWRIAVEDASGAPMTNAKVNWACAWMAVHGHGSNPQAINSLGNGVFELSKQNLSMYGPWEVRLWVDPTGGGPEYQPQSGAKVLGGNNCMPSNGATGAANITFDFCVPEGGS